MADALTQSPDITPEIVTAIRAKDRPGLMKAIRAQADSVAKTTGRPLPTGPEFDQKLYRQWGIQHQDFLRQPFDKIHGPATPSSSTFFSAATKAAHSMAKDGLGYDTSSGFTNLQRAVPPSTDKDSGLTKFGKGLTRGAAKGVEGLTSPANVAALGGMAAAGSIPVVGEAVGVGAGIYFTYEMAKGLVESIPEAKKAFAKKDWDKLGEIISSDALNALMLKKGGEHTQESWMKANRKAYGPPAGRSEGDRTGTKGLVKSGSPGEVKAAELDSAGALPPGTAPYPKSPRILPETRSDTKMASDEGPVGTKVRNEEISNSYVKQKASLDSYTTQFGEAEKRFTAAHAKLAEFEKTVHDLRTQAEPAEPSQLKAAQDKHEAQKKYIGTDEEPGPLLQALNEARQKMTGARDSASATEKELRRRNLWQTVKDKKPQVTETGERKAGAPYPKTPPKAARPAQIEEAKPAALPPPAKELGVPPTPGGTPKAPPEPPPTDPGTGGGPPPAAPPAAPPPPPPPGAGGVAAPVPPVETPAVEPAPPARTPPPPTPPVPPEKAPGVAAAPPAPVESPAVPPVNPQSPPAVTDRKAELEKEIARLRGENEKLAGQKKAAEPTPAPEVKPPAAPEPKAAAPVAPPVSGSGQPEPPADEADLVEQKGEKPARVHMDHAAKGVLTAKRVGVKKAQLLALNAKGNVIGSVEFNPSAITGKSLEPLAKILGGEGVVRAGLVYPDRPDIKRTEWAIGEMKPEELKGASKKVGAIPERESPPAQAAPAPPAAAAPPEGESEDARFDREYKERMAKFKEWSKSKESQPPPASRPNEPPAPVAERRPAPQRLRGEKAAEPAPGEYVDPEDRKRGARSNLPEPELKTDRPAPKRLRKPGQTPPESRAEEGGTESSQARTSGGKIKLGADVGSLGKVLGSSLYTGKEAQVVTKELIQNSMDAVRGVSGGNVGVKLDRYSGTIEITDNGKGMTPKDIETVFTDLGASGKRGQADASGGFGLAKAAPLMMSKELTVTSVAQVGGKKIKSTLVTTPESLLGQGVDLKTEEVHPNTPTGTIIEAKMPSNAQGWYEAEHFLRNTQKSIRPPGKMTMEGYSPIEPRNLKSLKKMAVPGADVEVYASTEKKGLVQKMGMVPVEINNNGIYQFDDAIYLGDYAASKDIPTVIAVDVKANVEEGHPDYPFSANREQLRGQAMEKVRDYVQKEIVEPSIKRANKFLEDKYEALPKMGSKTFDIPIFDSGDRLTPAEAKAFRENPDLINIGEEIATLTDQAIVTLMEGGTLPEGLKGLGETIERAGLVLSQELHGVLIENKGTKGSSIFINPFSFAEGATPTQAASLAWHTIKHEILHDKIKGHGQNFTSGEVKVAQGLGDLEIEALLRLRGAYAEPGNPGKFRKGINDALQVYRDSRGRAERERDPFGGEESRIGNPIPERKRGDAPPVSRSEQEPVRGTGAERGGAGPNRTGTATKTARKPEAWWVAPNGRAAPIDQGTHAEHAAQKLGLDPKRPSQLDQAEKKYRADDYVKVRGENVELGDTALRGRGVSVAVEKAADYAESNGKKSIVVTTYSPDEGERNIPIKLEEIFDFIQDPVRYIHRNKLTNSVFMSKATPPPESRQEASVNA